jgi:hypothetical protein
VSIHHHWLARKESRYATLTSSKLRSDDIISRDPEAAARAHILVAPPGTDLKEYLPLPPSRGIRGRARTRGRRPVGGGRRERGDGKMDLD